jgi:hypothetical protein
MAFEGILKVEDKSFKVVRCYITLKRQEDHRGRPTTDPTWRIFLLLDATDDNTLTNWMCDPTKKVTGQLSLHRLGSGEKVKEIEFKNSFCFKMRDFFNASHSFSSTFIGISGKDISINSFELVQRWPGF